MNSMDTLKEVVLSNGETLTYRERPGGEQLVILVHGNMTSSQHWDVLMENLNKEFHIIAPDLRGFGGSSYNKRITHIRDFAKDLKLFVDALSLKDFHLVGWSTGGMVCMQYCALYPQDCQKLVLLASGSTRGYPFYGMTPDGQMDLTKRFTTLQEIEQDPYKTKAIQHLYDTKNKEGLQAIWNASIYTQHQPETDQYELYLEDMLTQRNLADVYHSLNTFNISRIHHEAGNGTGEVHEITQPVLVIYGDRDFVIAEQMTNEIIEDFVGKAKVVKIENCGHSPLIDNLAQLTKEMEIFFLEG
ncbi:intracellular short-chain-length polyhydroxyalkanoate depolymerase [Lysinibacillus sp. 54212]|uniref:intracellular short-chain-length polyhydroxyalkanoate depolymerase n=1 Tax=Lysinibacillus sp. 54212 TaxID=3119829 RepID=UPI002FCA94DD